MHMVVAEPEDDPMVPRHRDAPEAFQVTSQGMQLKAWQVNVGLSFGNVQHAQDAMDLVDKIGPNLAAVMVDVQQFEPLMAPTHNHVRTVVRNVTVSNKEMRAAKRRGNAAESSGLF
jgi:capsule polysaccharide export protein KpsE/RkpR